MTEHTDVVEKRRLYLAAEAWGNKIAQHYCTKGGMGDLGYGMCYFVYYNNGAIHKLSNKQISIVQVAKPIAEVIDDYQRREGC